MKINLNMRFFNYVMTIYYLINFISLYTKILISEVEIDSFENRNFYYMLSGLFNLTMIFLNIDRKGTREISILNIVILLLNIFIKLLY